MIKLPKKIANAIKREFSSNYIIIKDVYLHSIFNKLSVHLVVFRIEQNDSLRILRYFGDDSYSFIGIYKNEKEVIEELQYQIKKFF